MSGMSVCTLKNKTNSKGRLDDIAASLFWVPHLQLPSCQAQLQPLDNHQKKTCRCVIWKAQPQMCNCLADVKQSNCAMLVILGFCFHFFYLPACIHTFGRIGPGSGWMTMCDFFLSEFMNLKWICSLPSLQNLALCTASLMYILSRDRLNMDLDRSCLDLMIRLLELELDQDQGGGAGTDSTTQFSAREIAKIKEKIRKLCDTVHNKHLDLQNITVLQTNSAAFRFVWLFVPLDLFKFERTDFTTSYSICHNLKFLFFLQYSNTGIYRDKGNTFGNKEAKLKWNTDSKHVSVATSKLRRSYTRITWPLSVARCTITIVFTQYFRPLYNQ